MASDIVADAKAWLEWRPPHRSSQDGRTHSGDCHRVHVDCLIARLTAEVERHRMTPEERAYADRVVGYMHAFGPSDARELEGYLKRTEPEEA